MLAHYKGEETEVLRVLTGLHPELPEPQTLCCFHHCTLLAQYAIVVEGVHIGVEFMLIYLIRYPLGFSLVPACCFGFFVCLFFGQYSHS